MKKKYAFFSFCIIGITLITYIFIGCNSESGTGEQKDFHLALADTILSQYNSERADWEGSVRTEGKVNISIKGNKILIEHDADNGYEHMIYFLQMEKDDPVIKPVSFKRAEVLFLDRNLLVNSLESKSTLHFFIKTDAKPEYLKEIKGVKSYSGIGLGLRKITNGSKPENVPYCNCEEADTYSGACKQGGPLSVTCVSANTDGSCRVSCSSQTYACCDKGYD